MQQLPLVGVVQRFGHARHDPHDILGRQTAAAVIAEQLRRVGALDEVHRDPQLAVVLAAVVHTDDVGMPQSRDHVGFAVEPLAILAVDGELHRQNLERVIPRQPGMLDEVHLAHAARTQRAHDGVPGEDVAFS